MSNYREDRPGAGGGGFDGIRSTPRRKSKQEQSGPYQKTHEELVVDFRTHIKSEQQAYRDTLKWNMSPEEIIQIGLHKKYEEVDETPRNRAKENFFQAIIYAWDILVYDRLDRESQYGANNSIAEAYNRHRTLRLNPTQVRILDAAAEAVGISRPRGQSEIQVPEKHYYWPYGHNGPGAIDPVTGGPGKE